MGAFAHPLRLTHLLKTPVLSRLILHKTNISLGIDAITALSYGHKSVLSDYKMISHNANKSYSPVFVPTYCNNYFYISEMQG